MEGFRARFLSGGIIVSKYAHDGWYDMGSIIYRYWTLTMSTSRASIDCLKQSQIGKMGSLHSSMMILAWLGIGKVMK